MTDDDRATALRLGAFTLDATDNMLSDGVRSTRLPLRLADLLRRLAAEPGQVVRRETLIDEVWSRKQVNDEVLSRAIADLRQALGDDARAPRYIETLPKIGYRLLVDVGQGSLHAPAAAEGVGTIPVMPVPEGGAHRGVALTRVVGVAAVLLALLAMGLWAMQRDVTSEPAVDPLTVTHLLRARPFTSDAALAHFPRFTPDGRWVVYTRRDGEHSQLRLRAVNGTEDRALVDDDGAQSSCGVVSPDGATLVWLRRRGLVCEWVHRSLLGGPVQVLAECGADPAGTCPDWSPDGRHLVIESAAVSLGLREIAFPEGTERVHAPSAPGRRDVMPRYSPDGRRIVFWRGDEAGRALWQLDRAQGEAIALDTVEHLGFGHAFSASGDLLLADDRFGQRALLRWSAADAQVTVLGGTGARFPDIARDGSIVYEVARYDANLWRIDRNDPSAPPRRLTQSNRYDSQPVHSPDGRWLAFVSNRDGREGIYLMSAEGGEARKLPLDPSLRWTSPAWSPDAGQLLLLRYDDQGARLCLHTLSSATTRCPDALAGERHGGFFLDADHVGAIDVGGAAPGLWRLSINSGAAERLEAPGAVSRCRASTQWLVCQRPGVAGLWVQDRRTQAVSTILSEASASDQGAWTLVDATVYIALKTTAQGGAAGVYRIELTNGEIAERVHDGLPTAIGDALDVTPDHSALVIVRTDDFRSDLMYVPPP